MKCDNCRKQVRETHSLYEEQPYNDNALSKRALNKLIRKGLLWLCKRCLDKARR